MGSARGGSNPLAVGAIARGAMNEKRCLAHGRPLRQNGGSREAPCNRESMVHMCGTRLAQRKTNINHTRRSNNSENKLLHRWQSLYSSVAERQSCKLKVLGSIPSEGLMACLQPAGCSLSSLWQQVVASLFVTSRLVANKLYMSNSSLMMAKKASISCKS